MLRKRIFLKALFHFFRWKRAFLLCFLVLCEEEFHRYGISLVVSFERSESHHYERTWEVCCMKLLLGSGKVLGTTFLALQERVYYSEHLSPQEALKSSFCPFLDSCSPHPRGGFLSLAPDRDPPGFCPARLYASAGGSSSSGSLCRRRRRGVSPGFPRGDSGLLDTGSGAATPLLLSSRWKAS